MEDRLEVAGLTLGDIAAVAAHQPRPALWPDAHDRQRVIAGRGEPHWKPADFRKTHSSAALISAAAVWCSATAPATTRASSRDKIVHPPKLRGCVHPGAIVEEQVDEPRADQPTRADKGNNARTAAKRRLLRRANYAAIAKAQNQQARNYGRDRLTYRPGKEPTGGGAGGAVAKRWSKDG
jgi:hypothetical protein